MEHEIGVDGKVIKARYRILLELAIFFVHVSDIVMAMCRLPNSTAILV